MSPPPALASHVAHLTETHRIDVTWRSSNRGRADYADRRISIPSVRSSVTYATALHEIGHLLDPAAHSKGGIYYDLEAEAYAWRWALRNAVEVDERFRAKVRSSLRSYWDYAAYWRDYAHQAAEDPTMPQLRGGAPSLPAFNHLFWLLVWIGCLCPKRHEGTCPVTRRTPSFRATS